MCNNRGNKFLLDLCGGCGVDEQQHFTEGDATEVLHRTGGKVGECEKIALVARIRNVVILLEPVKSEGSDLHSKLGEVALARHMNDAQRNIAHHDRLGCF